jgi:hypothetical protein
MSLTKLLAQKREEILDAWLASILDTYPADSAAFMKRQPNRFANPVGYTLAQETGVLFDHLLGDGDTDLAASALERINKIRAVQDFSASEAVAFVFFLKGAVRNVLSRELADGRLTAELLALESKIDDMALMAFDGYMQCREKIFQIRCDSIRRQHTTRRRVE